MKKTFIVLFTVLMLVACGKKNEKNNTRISDKKIHALVTTSFLYDMAENLMGDKVELDLIIPAGEDPHTYEPKPEDYQKIKNADIIFYHGLHFEGKMIELLEHENAISVSRNFDLSSVLSMEEEGKRIVDPHFWFDIDLYKKAVEEMALNFIEKIPDYEENIIRNRDSYLVKLENLKKYVIEAIATIPEERRVLITPHDAFSYFSKQNNIQVKAPQGVSTDSEVSTNDMIETVEFIISHKVKAVFAESTTDPARMEKLKESCLARGFEISVVSGEGNELFSDSLATKNHFGDNYLDMYKFNVDLIVKNLK